MSEFIHLHCHTEFSLLDGMPKVDEYVIRCNELNMPGIAITEHSVDDSVIKYGYDIGRVVEYIKPGAHVHTHNLKTKRW